ncbi:adseverin-like [Actinia tenebrosa]|uniref:Adseverin-like n=1 Tax=Actinia tenebrosa TaxID=6105 RepID=A0A6P8I6H3_ACTTE|nr:adseverin-like [Actinia tenebrosa]XP_031560633.1 adseverin-like [Actinia tenebrosa]
MAGLDPDMKADVDSVKGKTALIIWRDNRGNMERVPEKEYGKFYKGDCYVIYNCYTKKSGTTPVIHIHFLIGSESTGQDEQMDVAMFATILDEYLGGGAVQYRELMGNESVEFKAIFNGRRAPNLRYAKGGHESRLKKMDNSNRTQLYEIKGARIAQAVEVDVKLASLNSDDCYVLDGGKGLFVLLGEKSNRNEQAKAISLANSIRDNEQGGRGHVIIIDEKNLNTHDKRDEIRKLFELPSSAKLNFGNLRRLQARSDEDADKLARASKLYKICDAGDRVEMKELGPPRQELLNDNDCFILFTGRNVYVWKGKKASSTERAQAMANAKGFLKQLSESPNLGIVVMPQFAETAAFRACFPSWKDDSALEPVNVDYSKPKGTGGVARSVHTVIDFRALHEKPRSVEVNDPYANDNGQSDGLKIYKIDLLKNDGDNDDDKTLVDSGRNLVFNSADCYVLVYSYGPGGRKTIIYYWLGNESPQLKKGAAAKIAESIDDREFGGLAVQERVIEGKEPPHFMRIFNGYILVKQERLNGNQDHLYHVRAKKENDARVVEVDVDASNLNSNDCFILDSRKGMFLWYGKGSTGDERKVVQEAAAKLDPKRGASGNYTFYREGEERADFWNALGGEKSYPTELIPNLQDCNTKHEPRLFHCYNIMGSLQVEEVYEFDQDDLIPDDVFFLDTYYRLYIWVGKGARRDEKEDTIKFVQEFIRNDPTPRTDTDANICVISQGAEPDSFKAYFGVWEDVRTETMSAEDHKRLAMDRNAVSLEHEEEVPEGKFSLAELQVPIDELPYGVKVEKREMYLTDDQFEDVFKMSKENYMELPKWKKDFLRKQNNLF